MNVIVRDALVSLCDAIIVVMFLAAGFIWLFRWPLVVIWAVMILKDVL